MLEFKVKSGRAKSCGCAQRFRLSKPLTHGMSYSKEYRIWEHMISRCSNPKNTHFHNYGGRGIEVCDRWIDSFENFYEDMGLSNGLTIDRIDVNGNYEPGNCRWIPKSAQARNRRDTLYVSIGGKRQLLLDWAKELGLNYGVLKYRLGLAARLRRRDGLLCDRQGLGAGRRSSWLGGGSAFSLTA